MGRESPWGRPLKMRFSNLNSNSYMLSTCNPSRIENMHVPTWKNDDEHEIIDNNDDNNDI